MTDAARHFPRLDVALEDALRPYRRSASPNTLLFSGGLDSSLLAWELREAPGLELVTIGRLGAPDLDAARSGAVRLGLPLRVRTIDPADVESTVSSLGDLIERLPPTQRSVQVAMALALEASSRGLVVTGQGADELFLGYRHYRDLTPESARRRADDDLARLLDQDWPTTSRIAARAGRSVGAPYLAPGFVAAVRAVPIVERLPGELTKGLLRAWAVHRGLPEVLAARPKRAIQYGSGVDRLVRRGADG